MFRRLTALLSHGDVSQTPETQQPTAPVASVLPYHLRQVPLPPLSDISSSWGVAIDFETATSLRESPCAIGLAWINPAGVAHRAYKLIQPPDNDFDPFNISFHGIGPEHVANEPEFPQVWAEILPYLTGRTLIAHYAAFDLGVIRRTLDLYGLPYPDAPVFCTRNSSRLVWPGLPDYRLPTVASHLGYEFVHHHAGDDAAACGYVAHRQLADANIKTLEELAAQIGLHIGEIGIGSYSPCTKVRSIVTERISQIVSAGSVSGPSHPLFGKSLVFTGELRSFTRHDAATRAIACGAICQDNPTKTTSLLVVGASPGAGKLQKARTLQSKGSAIRVISEADFISLLG